MQYIRERSNSFRTHLLASYINVLLGDALDSCESIRNLMKDR